MKIEILNSKLLTRDNVLDEIAKYAKSKNITSNSDKLYKDFINRENQGTTAFENGIAIPHARSSHILEPAIIISRFNELDWQSLDDQKTSVAISIIVPESNDENLYMDTLAKVSSLLLDKKKIDILKNGDISLIKKILSESKKNKITNQKNKEGSYDYVAITTCATGVAHTNMAADALEKYAYDNNISLKVERQAAQGIVNELTNKDIKNAKYVIIAAGKQVENMERFDNKKVYKTAVVAPMKSSKNVFKLTLEEAKVQIPSRRTVAKHAASSSGGATAMQALMAGVSYMIPFVVVGGILIALSLGIGGTSTEEGMIVEKGSFWEALLNVGSAGFQLMIPILAGFIASAIGGRASIAPAMIIAFVVGNSDGQLWNWEKLEFGSFDNSASLGFLGAIATGFAVGYSIKWWNNNLSQYIPKQIKPVEPIILIPLLFTVILWVLFAFAFYLPLYYISYGLKLGIEYLVDKDLFFIVALIIGAMISFDMGGPINKIAFLTSAGLITEGVPQVMGAAAAAIAIPPLGMGLAVFMSPLFRNSSNFDDVDKGNAISAMFMSMVGITEGAIPFAVKYPKQAILANVIGGSIGAAVASIFKITDVAAHGGPIVYFVGAIGKDGITNYAYGLLFLLAIIIGSLITAVTMNVLFKFTKRKKHIKT